MLNEDSSIYINVMVWGVLAGIGGAAKYISTVIRSAETISNRRFLLLLFANIFVSSFSGLMGGLLMTTVSADPTWSFIASGLFGYLGTQGLDVLLSALKKKIDPTSALTPHA